MNDTVKQARMAGLLYLLMGLTGPIGLMIVPSRIMVAGDAALTAQNLVTYEWLVRIGILSNVICQTAFIFLVLALGRLFKEVNEKAVKLMIALVLVAVPIAFVNELAPIAALIITNGMHYLTVFDGDELNAMILFLLQLHEQGTTMVGLFWGLWLFPFGYLVIQSGFIPKIFGYLLMLGCLGYVLDSSISIVAPQYKVTTELLMIPLGIGEIAMMFWLLIKGVKKPIDN